VTTIAAIIAAFNIGYLLGLYCGREKPPLPNLTWWQRRWWH
jgi:hypothetical protein